MGRSLWNATGYTAFAAAGGKFHSIRAAWDRTPPPRTMRRIGGFHDVQQHERMTADLPPWRKRTRVAGRILSLNGTAGSMLDARWTW